MQSWKAHKKPIYSVVFSPCGQFVLTAAGDETLGLWDVEAEEQVCELPGSTIYAPIAWSPDGRFIIRGGYGVRCWDTDKFKDESGAWSAELAGKYKSKQNVLRSRTFFESLAFTPDSRSVFLHGSSTSPLTCHQLPSGESVECGWGGTRESNNAAQFPTGGMAIDPAGKRLAAVFGVLGDDRYDSTVILWSIKTGKELARLPAHPPVPEHATQLAWSPDGKLLAGVYGPVLIVWNVKSKTPVAYIQFGSTHFKGVAFANKGTRLLAANTDKTLRVFEVGNWGDCQTIDPKIGKLHAVAVAPNEQTVCIASHLGRIQIFDLE